MKMGDKNSFWDKDLFYWYLKFFLLKNITRFTNSQIKNLNKKNLPKIDKIKEIKLNRARQNVFLKWLIVVHPSSQLKIKKKDKYRKN